MSLDDELTFVPRSDGAWDCVITENYWLPAGPNGGYIGALLTHAAELHLDEPARQARGLTIHFLRRPKPGPAVLRAQTLHQGRSVSFVQVTLEQDDRAAATATGTWAKAREGIEHDAWTMPSVAPPEACVPMAAIRDGETMPIHQQWDIRSVDGVRFGQGEVTEMSWWIRPPEHRPLDAAMVVAMSDALPPPIFAVAMPGAGVPTLDLTVHLRVDLPTVTWKPGDWIMAHFVTRLAHGGFLEEDGDLWTADGTLIANCRQLAIST